jgi:hypothetical protein
MVRRTATSMLVGFSEVGFADWPPIAHGAFSPVGVWWSAASRGIDSVSYSIVPTLLALVIHQTYRKGKPDGE